MATIEKRGNRFRIIFYFGSKRYAASLLTTDRQKAEDAAGAVERCLMHLRHGVIVLPDGADLVTFVLSGGRREEKAKAPEIRTLASLTQRYVDVLNSGAIEANSLATVRIHLRHIATTLGPDFPIHTLKLEHLQRHVDRRRKVKSRRKTGINPVTIRKELRSFRACWNWGTVSGLVKAPFPAEGLKYPKGTETLPFQTWAEIERRIALDRVPATEQKALWDCLFLSTSEIDELLRFAETSSRRSFLYPMIVTAAHTGARRSELLRMRISDVDFEAGVITIQERKRKKGNASTRRVPLSPTLTDVLKAWIRLHPGGPFLFCHTGEVARSKKRSRTTGHKDQNSRDTTLAGRQATVSQRPRRDAEPLTRDEAHDHFRRTFAGSKWSVLRGWHVFRHSFVSACASKGIDQRLIDEWVGHTTEEMRRRYRHLYPSVQRQAMASVFADGK